MSHVAKIELEIHDLDALAKAANSLGLVFTRGQNTYRWYGRAISADSAPEGFTAADLGKCEHAIRIPGNSQAYEIGVTPRRDGRPGYTLLWDSWRGGFGLTEKIGENGEKLKQAYAAELSAKHYTQQGYRVTRRVTNSGRVIVEATK